jgi:signal transduction histidine kinase
MTFTGQNASPRQANEPEIALDVAGLVDSLPIGAAVLDHSGRVIHANPITHDIFGDSDDILERLNAGSLDAPHPDWHVVAGQCARRQTVRLHGANGRTHTLLVTLAPLAGRDHAARRHDATDSAPPALLIVFEDASRVFELEQRVAQAENMASVGRLAARVAHELNNPLDGTLRYINLCSRVLSANADEKVLEYIEQARQGLLRMTRIVSELLAFSRSTPVLEQSGNINWVVEEAIRSMSGYADQNHVAVAAGFHDDAAMPTLEGTKLFQVCCNLIKNAIDAMSGGGYLTITTGVVGGEVILRFEDTGKGLPPEPERIFEPFYTTKSVGQGTGLGLAICKDHIEQLRGRITAENGREKGAVFTVFIPVISCSPPK